MTAEKNTKKIENFTPFADVAFDRIAEAYLTLGKIAPERRWIWACGETGYPENGTTIQRLANEKAKAEAEKAGE